MLSKVALGKTCKNGFVCNKRLKVQANRVFNVIKGKATKKATNVFHHHVHSCLFVYLFILAFLF